MPETDEEHSSQGVSKGYAWYVIIVLAAAMAFSLVDRFALSLLFEPIKTDLGLSDTQLGLLHGIAFGLFYAFLGIPLAYLADKWSRQGVIVIGVGLWSLATAACGLSQSFWQLLASRIGVGAGEAGLAPAGYGIVTNVVPRSMMATAVSIFQMGAILGAGLALVAGGAIYEWVAVNLNDMPGMVSHLKAWQLTFIILALPGLPLLILLAFVKDPAAGKSALVQTNTVHLGFIASLRSQGVVYLLLFTGAGCLVAVSYGLISWAPTLFVREYQWETRKVGLMLGALMLTFAPAGTVFGGLLVDRLRDRLGRQAFPVVMSLAAFLTLPPLIGLNFSGQATTTFWCVAMALFSSGIPVGIGPAFTQVLAPEETKGRVSAVYVLAVNLIGLGVGPIMIGLMSDFLFDGPSALRTAFLVFSLTMTLIALMSTVLLARRVHH